MCAREETVDRERASTPAVVSKPPRRTRGQIQIFLDVDKIMEQSAKVCTLFLTLVMRQLTTLAWRVGPVVGWVERERGAPQPAPESRGCQ